MQLYHYIIMGIIIYHILINVFLEQSFIPKKIFGLISALSNIPTIILWVGYVKHLVSGEIFVWGIVFFVINIIVSISISAMGFLNGD